MEGKEREVGELVRRSVEDLTKLIDVDAAIGAPIVTGSGCRVIPVSKVTAGYLTGGGEYGEINVIKEGESAPFAGGNGAIVSLKPAGFLLDDRKSCTFIHAGGDPLDHLIDKLAELVEKIAGSGE